MRTVVPLPGADVISSVPPDPLCALLHRGEPEPARPGRRRVGIEPDGRRPRPRAAARPWSLDSRTVTCAAWACRSALWSASCAIRSSSASRALLGGRLGSELQPDLALAVAAQQLDVLAQRPAQTVLREVGRAQLEDERAELIERLLRLSLQLPDVVAGGGWIALEQRPRCLRAQHEPEELLADGVVEIERQPVALGGDRELPRLLVQARVRDRDCGMSGEQPDQLLVLVGEVGRVELLGQVERPDHSRRRHDRDAEERAHVRMAIRPPAAEARVLVDVGGAVRRRGLEHCPEHTVLPRQRAERGDQAVAHPGGEEAPEAAVAVGQPERRVPRPRQLARAVHEPLQDLVDRQLGRHRQHGVADGPQLRTQRLHHLP